MASGCPADATVNRCAIQAALDVANASGGDVVYVPKGHYFIDQANYYGLLCSGHSRIKLTGDGDYLSRIQMVDGAGGHIVGLINVSDFTVQGIGLDHGVQTVGHGIRVEGADNLRIEDCTIRNAKSYGIGLQGGALKRIRLRRLEIIETGADGIDFKNLLNQNQDIEISGVAIRGFGLDPNVDPGKAGIDVRGPARLSNIEIFGIQEQDDAIRFRPGESSDPAGIGGHQSVLTNFRVNGAGKPQSKGLVIGGRQVTVSGGFISGVDYGVAIHQQECSLAAVSAYSCGTGFLLNDAGTYPSKADRTQLSACIARSCSGIGFDIETDGNTMEACVSRTNATGIRITGNNNRWSGSRIGDSVTNTGTGNTIT